MQAVIDDIVALLTGQPVDLSTAPLDMDGLGDLDREVYEAARTIPPGRTASYGDIATRLGDPTLARAVGQALGRNPFAIVVPCHRVVGADGRLTGFSANGGIATKERMLVIEGARPEAPTLFSHAAERRPGRAQATRTWSRSRRRPGPTTGPRPRAPGSPPRRR